MSIYDPLKQRLASEVGDSIVVTFAEIETILVRTLPRSAYEYPAWWANEESDETSPVQCLAWLSAGFRATPDLSRRTVKFERYANAPSPPH
jgi:hypothetical protein